MPLYCPGDDGVCFVSTASLDGETNLKARAAPPAAASRRNFAPRRRRRRSGRPRSRTCTRRRSTAGMLALARRRCDDLGLVVVFFIWLRSRQRRGRRARRPSGIRTHSASFSVCVVLGEGADEAGPAAPAPASAASSASASAASAARHGCSPSCAQPCKWSADDAALRSVADDV